MEILLISNGSIEKDGRLIELAKVCRYIGNTKIICLSNTIRGEYFIDENSRHKYLKFLYKCIFVALKRKKFDILLIDNIPACFAGNIIRLINRPKIIIQDVRELYFIRDVGKIGSVFKIFETITYKYADIILVANRYRAEIMKSRYGIKEEKVIIFENLRVLDEEYNEKEMYKKFNNLFLYKYNVIDSGLISKNRKLEDIILSMKGLESICGLFIAGSGPEEDIYAMKRIISNNKIENVFFLGNLSRKELKYVINHSQIGVVNYGNFNLNNKYCASGKIYEYLYEGIPIICTDNKPLKDFIAEFEVGIATTNFREALIKMINNYEKYKAKVEKYKSKINVEEHNKILYDNIMKRIKIKMSK
jgi:hypothetical protein